MGLFDKKYCSVCGEKIGLLGNRKLEDGNLCKHCARKLSYWFDDRRHSTVEQIKEQLAYREENAEKVAAFNVTRTIGRKPLIVLDEDKHQFTVLLDGDIRDMQEENPDILDFSQVIGCDMDIDENRSEEKRETSDGRQVSYNPPRYTWDFDFHMTIRVQHPYFDEMRFDLNRGSVRVESNGTGGFSLFGNVNGAFDPHTHPDYQEYVEIGKEIKEALMQMRQQTRENIAAANAPKTPVRCPQCNAMTLPDESGCCEYCGCPIR